MAAARRFRSRNIALTIMLLLLLTGPAVMTREVLAQADETDTLSESDQLLGLKKSPPPAPIIPGVASVDLAMLMLLHPRMQLFSFSAGMFEKDFPAKTTAEGRARIARERITQRTRTFETNRARYDEVSRQRAELGEAIGKLQMDLNRDTLEAKDRAGQIDVAAAIAKLEAAFWTRKQTLEAEWGKLNAEMVALNEQADAVAFTTAEEKEKAAATMEAEILAAVQTVAKGRGYGTVLNSSFVLPDATSEKKRAAPESQPYLEAFDNPYATFWTDPRDKGASPQEATIRLASALSRWVAFRPKMLETILSRPINRLVLTGGRDLTLDVLAFLLRKYRMPEERARLLLETLQTLQRKG